MNKTLIKLGVAIWGLVLLLGFIIGFALGAMGMDTETILAEASRQRHCPELHRTLRIPRQRW